MYAVFNTFINDRWKVEKLSDEDAGKLWKALLEYFDTEQPVDLGDEHLQYVFEDFKRTNIRCRKANQSRSEKMKGNDNARKQ